MQRDSSTPLRSARNDRAANLDTDWTFIMTFATHSAAMNMAIDETLFETAVVPIIRFYRWRSPALSFGYFGKFSDVTIYARGTRFHFDVGPAAESSFTEMTLRPRL